MCVQAPDIEPPIANDQKGLSVRAFEVVICQSGDRALMSSTTTNIRPPFATQEVRGSRWSILSGTLARALICTTLRPNNQPPSPKGPQLPPKPPKVSYQHEKPVQRNAIFHFVIYLWLYTIYTIYPTIQERGKGRPYPHHTSRLISLYLPR